MTAPLRRSGVLVSTIQSGCENKRRYSDEMGARCAGQCLQEKSGVALYLYPCKLCRGWHLTKQKQKHPMRSVSWTFSPTPR